jgi:hypothetical protein
VAVSIHSNLDLAQLLSKRPSGDSANSAKNSAKIGSETNPQWNGVPQSDPSFAADPEQTFSNALQTALADMGTQSEKISSNKAQPVTPGTSDPAQTLIATQPGAQTVKRPVSPDTPLPGSNSSSPDLLSLLLSSQQIASAKSAKNSDEPGKTEAQQLQDSSDGSHAAGPPYLLLAAPTEFATPIPAGGDPTAAKAGDVPPPAATLPNQSLVAAAAVASAAAPGAAMESPAVSAATESVVFDGHLTASPKQDTAPSPPAPTPAPNSDAKPPLPIQPASQPIQAAPTQPQSQVAAQPRPPANANSSSPSVDIVGSPGVPTGNSAGKNSSFGQELKQDGKSSGQNQGPALPSSFHSGASANFPPSGAQNNLNAPQQTSASTHSDAQPIVNQSPSVQTNVKTDMNLKMQSQSGDNITVRLSERAGGIQVTVRSSDPTTSAMLRHELPNIQAGLEQAGWQLSSAASQHSPSQHSNSNTSQNSDQGGNGQQSGYGAQEQQKRRNNAQHQWFELMQ